MTTIVAGQCHLCRMDLGLAWFARRSCRSEGIVPSPGGRPHGMTVMRVKKGIADSVVYQVVPGCVALGRDEQRWLQLQR